MSGTGDAEGKRKSNRQPEVFLPKLEMEIYGRDLETYPSVFYIGRGKTGSQSICAGFAKNKVAHWHSEVHFRHTYKINLGEASLLDLVDHSSELGGKESLVIESTRDPVERTLSVLFQEFYAGRIDPSLAADKDFAAAWTESFLDCETECQYAPYAERWLAHYGVDLMAEFDRERKCLYRHLPDRRVKLLFMRYENIDSYEGLIRAAGYEFSMPRVNSTSDRRDFAEQYRSMREGLKFPSSKLDRWYDNEWVECLYSPDEIERMKARHRRD